MTSERMGPRLVLASASVAVLVIVVATAAALGPGEFRRWLVFSAVLAVIASLQSVASDQRDLTAALLLSLPPVVALIADGSPGWMIAPLGVLLLVAGELNALSWDCQGHTRITAGQRNRLLDVVPLALLGLVASFAVVAVANGPRPDGILAGTLAVGGAAVVLGVLGRLVFRRSG